MSTRSNIIVKLGDGQYKRVYCHFDGYPEGVSKTLVEHYNSQDRAETVVAPGDMSLLGARCDKPDGHSYNNRHPDCTVYYGRDRGEINVDGLVASTLTEAWPDQGTWTEFVVYVWDGQSWWCGDPDVGPESLKDLRALLDGKEELHPDIKAFGMVIGTHGRASQSS